MNEAADTRAIKTRALRISPIWLLPILAALIGLWMIWHGFATRGPLITIMMETAEGIEANKTLIKARDVAVGKVADVRLSENLDHIIVSARMNPDTLRLLREDTQVWVVKPRIGRGGISGLGTVVSGVFIQLQPGKSANPRLQFTALEQPPFASQGSSGLRLRLRGARLQAAKEGDPVTFQGYEVGRVESAEFDVSSRQQLYRIRIDAPFTSLVNRNTRFWSSSGFKVNLGADGISVTMNSLEGLLGGGIEFGLPPGLTPGAALSADDSGFILYPDQEAAQLGAYDRKLDYVLLLTDGARGLKVGAPVEYRGLRVGTVAQVPLQSTPAADTLLNRTGIPVLIHIEPQRLDPATTATDDSTWRQRFSRLVEDGLRASLSASNLLTGALRVDLDFHPDAPKHTPSRLAGVELLPTVAGGLAGLEQKLARVLDRLASLPLEPVLENLDAGLQASRLALSQAQNTAASLDELLRDPALRALPATVQQSLSDFSRTLEAYSADGPAYQDLNMTLKRLDRLMRDLQPLLRTLDEKPNALLFNRSTANDPIPSSAR